MKASALATLIKPYILNWGPFGIHYSTASGNGATYDHVELQADIDAAEGHTLYLNPGRTYRIHGTLYLGNVHIIGNGATLEIYSDATFERLGTGELRTINALCCKAGYLAGYGLTTQTLEIEGLTIYQHHVDVAAPSVIGALGLENLSGGYLRDVTITSGTGDTTPIDTVDIYRGVQDFLFENCVFETLNGNTQGGFWLRNYPAGAALRDCRNITIRKCRFTTNHMDEPLAIYVSASGGSSVIDRILVDNCQFYVSGEARPHILTAFTGVAGSTVSNVTWRDCHVISTTAITTSAFRKSVANLSTMDNIRAEGCSVETNTDSSVGSIYVYDNLDEISGCTADVVNDWACQRLIVTGTPTAGHYHLTFDGLTTGELAYNATAAELQTALRLLAGLEAVTVTATGVSPDFTHKIVLVDVQNGRALMTKDTSALTGGTMTIALYSNLVAAFRADRVVNSKNTYSGLVTHATPYSARGCDFVTNCDLQGRLYQVRRIRNCQVYGSWVDGQDITDCDMYLTGPVITPFRHTGAGLTAEVIRIERNTIFEYERQTVTITGTATGGHYHLEYDGETTGDLAWDATSAELQTALRLLTGLSAVTVYTQSGSPPDYVHLVSFALTGGTVLMTADVTGLTGGAPAIAIAKTPTAADTVFYFAYAARYRINDNLYQGPRRLWATSLTGTILDFRNNIIEDETGTTQQNSSLVASATNPWTAYGSGARMLPVGHTVQNSTPDIDAAPGWAKVSAFGDEAGDWLELPANCLHRLQGWVAQAQYEIQKVVMGGYISGGHYHLTYGAATTGGLDYVATAATVQTALRLLAGLGSVRVTSTGVAPYFTHYVEFVGVAGDATTLTYTNSLSGTPTITVSDYRAYSQAAGQNTALGTLPANSYVTDVRIHCTEAFDSDGTDLLSVGYDADADAFATDTDVSSPGVLAVTLGTLAGYNATSREVEAYYVNGGSEPTTGKALVVLEYYLVDTEAN